MGIINIILFDLYFTLNIDTFKIAFDHSSIKAKCKKGRKSLLDPAIHRWIYTYQYASRVIYLFICLWTQ